VTQNETVYQAFIGKFLLLIYPPTLKASQKETRARFSGTHKKAIHNHHNRSAEGRDGFHIEIVDQKIP
jgi:hypothetical protein